MDSPWILNAFPTDVEWISDWFWMDPPLTLNGFPMALTGFPMGSEMVLNGSPIGFYWNPHGFWMDSGKPHAKSFQNEWGIRPNTFQNQWEDCQKPYKSNRESGQNLGKPMGNLIKTRQSQSVIHPRYFQNQLLVHPIPFQNQKRSLSKTFAVFSKTRIAPRRLNKLPNG